MEPILIGVTDRSVLVYIPDPASTDGSGKTGLVAANLTVSYTRMETDNDAVVTDVTTIWPPSLPPTRTGELSRLAVRSRRACTGWTWRTRCSRRVHGTPWST